MEGEEDALLTLLKRSSQEEARDEPRQGSGGVRRRGGHSRYEWGSASRIWILCQPLPVGAFLPGSYKFGTDPLSPPLLRRRSSAMTPQELPDQVLNLMKEPSDEVRYNTIGDIDTTVADFDALFSGFGRPRLH